MSASKPKRGPDRAGRKLFWKPVPPPPDGPKVVMSPGRIHRVRNAFPFLKAWYRQKGADLGHDMSIPKRLPGDGKATFNTHRCTGYCRVCGLPAKAWIVNRKDHARLAAARTILVDGEPVAVAPEGTVRYLFRGEGPAFRIVCPGAKPRAKRDTATTGPGRGTAVPVQKKQFLYVRVDLRNRTAAVVAKDRPVIDDRFVAVVEQVRPAGPPDQDRHKLEDLIEGAGPDCGRIVIVVEPNDKSRYLTPRQKIDSDKFYEMLFGTKKTAIMEKIDTEV